MDKRFDEIHFSAESPKDKEDLQSEYEKPNSINKIEDWVGKIEDLEKTPQEEEAIRLVSKSVGSLTDQVGLEGRLDNLPINVHVLSPDEFKKIQARRSDIEPAGFTQLRDVYMFRNEDISDFLIYLSHEMVHAISFLEVGIKKESIKSTGLKRLADFILSANPREHISIYDRKSAYRFTSVKEGKPRANFEGLNEGITDVISLSVRRRVLDDLEDDNTITLTDEQKENIKYSLPYPFHAFLVQELIKDLAGVDDPEIISDILSGIINDYSTGDYSFLKELEKKHKGITGMLYKMGLDGKGVIEVADALGFEELVEVMNEIK